MLAGRELMSNGPRPLVEEDHEEDGGGVPGDIVLATTAAGAY
jgi:hypothetical protein